MTTIIIAFGLLTTALFIAAGFAVHSHDAMIADLDKHQHSYFRRFKHMRSAR